MVLDSFEPKSVFKYFEEICGIPHPSYNTDLIADYVVAFAREHCLEHTRDSHNNVVIKKSASADYSGNDTVIIQGHLDMVGAKDDSTVIDFVKEPISIDTDGKFVFAKGTTLGGDDGIAVAMALAILADDSITHPNLECVFTTDEEIGMLGANAMDMSSLKGRYLLNIDSEDEGQFTVSCAGGETLVVELPLKPAKESKRCTARLAVSGLIGGHSGVEIDKGRANAVILASKILGKISNVMSINICSIEGGQKDNAIPFECETVFSVDDFQAVREVVDSCIVDIMSEYADVEKGIRIQLTQQDSKPAYDSGAISFLSQVTNGICAMSDDIAGLVQTSSNLGVIRTEEDKIVATFSLRSSIEVEKLQLHAEIERLALENGARVSSFGAYPAWEYKKNSRLQSLCKDIYLKQYGEQPEIVAIHAGLECGIFCSRLEGLDCISFGPNLLDIHTANERMEIESVRRVYLFLVDLLGAI